MHALTKTKSKKTESECIKHYGRSISTRVFSGAIHGNPAKRVRSISLPRSPKSTETSSLRETDDISRQSNENEFQHDERARFVESKMSRYKRQEKPKIISRNVVNLQSSRSHSDAPALGDKRKKSKRSADAPLFPNDYSKRFRSPSMSPATSDGNNRSIMDTIREMFPVFQKGARKSVITSPIPKVQPSGSAGSQEQNREDRLDSPFRRLCVTQENSIRTQSEGIFDIPFRTPPSAYANLPVNLSRDHFCRLVNDHLGKIRKELNLPNLAEEAKAALRQAIQQQSENEARRRAAEALIDISLTPSPPGGSIPSGTGVTVYNSSMHSKTVPEMVQMFRHRPNPDSITNSDLYRGENKTGADGRYFPEYYQRHAPMEPRITTLEGHGTTSSVYQFNKEDLKRMKVIGQVDAKFIVSKCVLMSGKEALVLFDQHAVHERVRLEALVEKCRQDRVNSSLAGAPIKLVPISPPIQLKLTDTEVQVVNSYKEHFEHDGISTEVTGNRNLVLIHSVPVAFVETMMREAEQNRDEKILTLIQASIENQVRSILNMQKIPRETFDLLRSQACRSAIKFGDLLDRQTCQELMTQLAQCNSPFQCAHGRPVLTPLLDLSSIPGTPAYQADIACYKTNA